MGKRRTAVLGFKGKALKVRRKRRLKSLRKLSLAAKSKYRHFSLLTEMEKEIR